MSIARSRLWLLAVSACVEYQPKGLDVGEPDACEPCGTRAELPGTVISETCFTPDTVIEDPWNIVVKQESWATAPALISPGQSMLVGNAPADATRLLAWYRREDAADLDDETLGGFAIDGSTLWEATSYAYGKSMFAFARLSAEHPAVFLTQGFGPSGEPAENPYWLVARDAAGAFVWGFEDSFPDGAYGSHNWSGNGVTVADIEGDGTVEVLTLGSILSADTGLREGTYDLQWLSLGNIAVADVDRDGDLEWLQSGVLYDTDGSRIWALDDERGTVAAAVSVAVQLDDDDAPEFISVANDLIVVDTDGTVLARVAGVNVATDAVVVAQLDGIGNPEVVVSDYTRLAAYHTDGTLYWERYDYVVTEYFRAWDIDADGRSELILIDAGSGEVGIPTITSHLGDTLWTAPRTSVNSDVPLVVDLDQDGHAEIIFGGGETTEAGTPLLTVYHQANDTWPAAGEQWATRDFYINNISPDGSVPRGEADPPSWHFNVHHARPAFDRQGTNLIPALLDTCADTCDNTIVLEAAVSNTGHLPAFDVSLRVYVAGVLHTEQVIPRVGAAERSAGVFFTLTAAEYAAGVELVVDEPGAWPECDEGDNRMEAGA